MLTSTAIHHVHDAKPSSNDERPAKQAFDLFRGGVGGHIKIFGAQTQQQVTHRTAHHISLKPRILQSQHHVQGALIDQGNVDAMD